MNVVKSLTRDPRLVPGAGGSELALSRALTDLADRTAGLNQHAIRAFAAALLVVPRTLAETAGLDATETVARLVATPNAGVDIDPETQAQAQGEPFDPVAHGILDPLAAKLWAIKYACTAATTVLSVDSIIMSKPAGIKAPKANPNWDDDD